VLRSRRYAEKFAKQEDKTDIAAVSDEEADESDEKSESDEELPKKGREFFRSLLMPKRRTF